MTEEVLNQDQVEKQVPQQEEPPKKLSVVEFASKIKAKYPEYKNIDDNELTSKMLSKFPTYKDQVDFTEKKNIGQTSKVGGQEPKQGGVSPTPSQSQSKSQEVKPKPSWETSALNPITAVNKAVEEKKKEPIPKQKDWRETVFDKSVFNKPSDATYVSKPVTGEKIEQVEKSRQNMSYAIDNTTVRALKNKGLTVPVNSPIYIKQRKKIEEAVKNGDAAYTVDPNTNEPALSQTTGFLESLKNSFNKAFNDEDESEAFVNKMTREQRVEYANKKREEAYALTKEGYVGEKPSEFTGEAGEIIGGAVPFVSKMVTAGVAAAGLIAAAPETFGGSLVGLPAVLGFAFTTPSMIHQGGRDEVLRRYSILKDKNPDVPDIDLMSQAENGLYTGEIVGGLTNLAFTAIGAKPVAAEAMPVIQKSIANVLKNTAKGTAKSAAELGTISAIGEAGKEVAAGIEDERYKLSAGEVINDAAKSFASGATAGALLHTATQVVVGGLKMPGQLYSSIKYGLSKENPVELQALLSNNEKLGNVPEGTTEAVMADLNSYNKSLEKTSQDLTPETQASVAGLIQKKENLMMEMSSKDSTQINPYLKQIDAINEQIKKITETNDPFAYEVNDVTGQPLDGKIEEVSEQKTIEVETPEQKEINTSQTIVDKINNNEPVNIDEVEKARTALYNLADAKPEVLNLIEPLIQKIESYENLTKTETIQTTERKPVEGTVAAKQRITIKPVLEQSEGSTARVTLADGTTGEGTLRVKDGNYVIEVEGQEPIIVGEKAITDRDLRVPEGESPVELDENGNVKSATFETRDGHKVTITDPEKALDLGIQLSLETVGEIPDEAFDRIYEDVIKEDKIEVPIEKPKVEKKVEPEAEVPKQKEGELSPEEADIERRRKEELDKLKETVQLKPIEILDEKGNVISTTDKEAEINKRYDEERQALKEKTEAEVPKQKKKQPKGKAAKFVEEHIGEGEGEPKPEPPTKEKTGEEILKELEDKGTKSSDDKSLNELAEKNKGNKVKRKIIEQARKAIKALKSIFPSMDIHLHENEQEYNDVMDKIGTKKSTGGNFAYVKNADGTYSGRIDINLNKANNRTVAHEVTHAILFKAFGENQEVFQSFRDKISKILGSATEKGLKEFADSPFYKQQGVTAEEYLAELTGVLNSKTISPLTLAKIASAINALVSKITGGKFIPFEEVTDAKDIMEFFDKVASAIKKGNDLSGIAKEKIVETPKQKKNIINSRMQQWGAFEKLGFEETEEFRKLVESGHIVKDYDLSNVAGMPVFIINPDNMIVGSVKLGEKVIGEGKGGVHFVSDTGDVWAFSDTSRGKVNAKKMAEFVNNQLKKNGVAHIILSRGDLGKLFSSHAGARGAMRVLEALVEKKIVSKMDFRNALKDVSMMKDIEGAKEELEDLIKQKDKAIKNKKPFDSKKEQRINDLQTNLEGAANKKYNINFTGIKLETIHNDVESQFFNKSDNTFSNRGTFVTDIIEHLAKNGEFSKEQISKLRQYLNSKELPASTERKTGNIDFSLKSIKDAVGLLFSDEATVGGQNSDAYALIKVENPKFPVEMVKGEHESYGAHLRQVVDNIPLDIFLKENTNLQKEDLIINKKNEVIGIRPRLLLLSEKNHIADVVNNDKNEPTVANKLGSNTIGLAEGIIKQKSDFPEQKIKSRSQLGEEKDVSLSDETKKYGQESKSTENPQGREGLPKSITAGETRVGEERPRNAESYSNPDGTPQYAVKRSDSNGGKRLDITVNGTNSKAKAVFTQSEQLKSAVNNYRNAYTDKNLIELDDPKLFHKLITQSKDINEFGASVHVYEPEEYAQMRLFITPDGKAGVAIKEDGDLVSGFSNQEADKPRRIAQLLGLAIKEGAMKADSFDTVLPQYYLDFGLIPVAQDKWNEQFKPEKWDKKVFEKWNNGEPDVIYYVYKGGDRATISERAGDFGSWKDLKKDVPYAEYDDAVKIQEENIKSKAQLPQQDKVEQLRAQEQAEYDAMPNPNDKAKRQEIYDKYDKLITPLLKEGVGEIEAVKAVEPYKQVIKGTLRDEELKPILESNLDYFKEIKKGTIGVRSVEFGKEDGITYMDTFDAVGDKGVRYYVTENNKFNINKPSLKIEKGAPKELGKAKGWSQEGDLYTNSDTGYSILFDKELGENGLYQVLDSEGFDAIGEGFKDIKIAKKAADEQYIVDKESEGDEGTTIVNKSQVPVDKKVSDMKDILREYVDEGKSLDEIKGIMKDEFGDYYKSVEGVIEQAHQEMTTTAIKNAVTERERAERGLSEVEVEAKRSFGKVFDDAKNMVANGEANGLTLAAEIVKNPRPLKAEESAVLLIDRMRISNEYNRKNAELLKAQENGETDKAEIIQSQLEVLEEEMELNDEAARKSGYEQGLGLAARRMLIAQDYSLVTQMSRLKAANGGKEVPKQYQEQLKDLIAKLEEANAKLEKLEKNQAGTEKQKQLGKVKPVSRTPEQAATEKQNIKNKIVSKWGQTLARMKSVVRSTSQIISKASITPQKKAQLESIVKDVNDMVKLYAELGETNLKTIINEIHKDLVGAIPDLDKSDIEDVVLGIYDVEKVKTPLTKEKIEAQANLRKVKTQIDLLKEELKNKQRSVVEKGVDYIHGWHRFAILSGAPSAAKIGTAALTRGIVTRGENIVGQALSLIPGIRQIAKKAPRQGGLSASAEAKAFTTWFDKMTIDDVRETMKTGMSSIDYLYGKKEPMAGKVPEWMEFFGRMHGAIKLLPKRAEFFRSLEMRTEHALKNGKDVNDPMVQQEMATAAYNDAIRTIFMQDNPISSSYTKLVNGLEKDYPAFASVMKFVFPIVKVPVNYVSEQVSYLPPIAAVKMMTTLYKGRKGMSGEQADYFMRALKKGAIGTAFIFMGYMNPQALGGYYTGKRKEDELEAGDIELFGTKLPHFMTHTPLLEMLQVGATMRRASDAKIAKGEEPTKFDGIPAIFKGEMTQVPFIGTGQRVMKLADNKTTDGFKDYGYSMGQSILEPQLMQNIADWTDKKEGESIKRKPEGFVETLKEGVPGLRQTLKEQDNLKLSKKDQEEYSNIIDKGINIPELNRRTSYRVKNNEQHPDSHMTEEEFTKFISLQKGFAKESYKEYYSEHKGLFDKLQKMIDAVPDTPKEKSELNILKDKIQNKIDAIHNRAIEKAKRKLNLK